jgi:hypothetical protein
MAPYQVEGTSLISWCLRVNGQSDGNVSEKASAQPADPNLDTGPTGPQVGRAERGQVMGWYSSCPPTKR